MYGQDTICLKMRPDTLPKDASTRQIWNPMSNNIDSFFSLFFTLFSGIAFLFLILSKFDRAMKVVGENWRLLSKVQINEDQNSSQKVTLHRPNSPSKTQSMGGSSK